MTLQQLTYLSKVAECGNITEAADKLYISQPSLSTAISNLEVRDRVCFKRSGRKKLPTKSYRNGVVNVFMLLPLFDCEDSLAVFGIIEKYILRSGYVIV